MSAPRGGVGKSGRRREAGAFEESKQASSPLPSSLADHRAIGFACRRRQSLQCFFFPAPPAHSEETYTYFIGSFFLSSMASCFARERWREREVKSSEELKEERESRRE